VKTWRCSAPSCRPSRSAGDSRVAPRDARGDAHVRRNEPHQRILSGDVRRGEVLRIRAAMLFADMRDFTAITATMSDEEATDLVNQYYDCIVPDRGACGEVLKFIGDGILAVFRAGENNEVEACWRALAAARARAGDRRRAQCPPARACVSR